MQLTGQLKCQSLVFPPPWLEAETKSPCLACVALASTRSKEQAGSTERKSWYGSGGAQETQGVSACYFGGKKMKWCQEAVDLSCWVFTRRVKRAVWLATKTGNTQVFQTAWLRRSALSSKPPLTLCTPNSTPRQQQQLQSCVQKPLRKPRRFKKALVSREFSWEAPHFSGPPLRDSQSDVL